MGEFVFPEEAVFNRVKFAVGTEIPQTRTQARLLGGLIVLADSEAAVIDKMQTAVEKITVDGQPFKLDINNVLE